MREKSTKYEHVELSHRALLLTASVIVKTFLMAIASSQIFCGAIEPSVVFFQCGSNIGYVAGSVAAVAIMGALFGYYIVRLKAFEVIFARMMKADFIITAMYFGVAFSAPSMIAGKVMIWLFGIWILGMLLAPFNRELTILKKVTEYGSLVALGALLTAHFIPAFQEYGSSYTLGMMVSSVLGMFGAGRAK
ncbi:MAG: hypothetical protein MN733_11635 [Nitrososphaera sp.]|nr:hypothetical protein [Nitrososphaera sp.]